MNRDDTKSLRILNFNSSNPDVQMGTWMFPVRFVISQRVKDYFYTLVLVLSASNKSFLFVFASWRLNND